MKKYLTPFLIATLPIITQANTLQTSLAGTQNFIFKKLVPFLYGIAFLFIVINVFRYFILGGTSEDGREKAKQLIIYGVAAFVFISVFYGIVNLFVGTTGLEGENAPQSDYQTRPGAADPS